MTLKSDNFVRDIDSATMDPWLVPTTEPRLKT